MSHIKGTPTQGLIGATLGFFFGFAAVSLFGPTSDFLQEGAGLSPALAGLLIAIPNLSGSLLRIPFSAMVDTDGGRRPFIILLSLSLVGVLGIFGVLQFGSGNLKALFPLLLGFGVLGGCGSATFSVGISQTSYWFPAHKQGSALGAYAGIGNLAPGIFAFLLSAVTIPLLGLAGSYLSWFILLSVGTLLYIALGRNAWYFQLRKVGKTAEEAREEAEKTYGQAFFPKQSVRESLKTSAAVWQTWGLVAIYFTSFGGFMALTGWFPKYWLDYHGTSLALAGGLTALYSLGASLIRIAGGGFADRIGGERAAMLALAVTLVGALIVSFAAGLPVAVFGVVLMAAGMGTANAAVFKMVPQMVPAAIGGAAGLVGGLGAFGGFVLPNLLAAFVASSQNGVGYARGFLVFVLLAVVSMGITLIFKRSLTRSEA